MKEKNKKERKIIIWECIKSIVNGFLFGIVLVFYFIFASIAFIFDVDFVFDVFHIGKKKK